MADGEVPHHRGNSHVDGGRGHDHRKGANDQCCGCHTAVCATHTVSSKDIKKPDRMKHGWAAHHAAISRTQIQAKADSELATEQKRPMLATEFSCSWADGEAQQSSSNTTSKSRS